MKIPELPFTTTDWSQVPSTEHSGETGRAFWRIVSTGTLTRAMPMAPGERWSTKLSGIQLSGIAVTLL